MEILLILLSRSIRIGMVNLFLGFLLLHALLNFFELGIGEIILKRASIHRIEFAGPIHSLLIAVTILVHDFISSYDLAYYHTVIYTCFLWRNWAIFLHGDDKILILDLDISVVEVHIASAVLFLLFLDGSFGVDCSGSEGSLTPI